MSVEAQQECLRIATQALEVLRNGVGNSPENRAIWQETTNVISTLNYIKGKVNEN